MADQPRRRTGRLGAAWSTGAGRRVSSSGSAEMAEATRVLPSQISTVPSSARATSISTSSGGGVRSRTVTVAEGSTSWARCPLVQPPLPDAGGPAEAGGDQEGLVHRGTVARACARFAAPGTPCLGPDTSAAAIGGGASTVALEASPHLPEAARDLLP